MRVSLVEQHPTTSEVERLRLMLSTFQDGTGHLKKDDRTLPDWRDFERAVAAAFGGEAQESKAVFDVLLAHPSRTGVFSGISCKSKDHLNKLTSTGQAYLELTNSFQRLWKALKSGGITSANIRKEAGTAGALLIAEVQRWHAAVATTNGGHVDLALSCYLMLSYNKAGDYQLHLFPLTLDSNGLTWSFPTKKAKGGMKTAGVHLAGVDQSGRTIFDWYPDSGAQLKYYPPVDTAIWTSSRFRFETLAEGGPRYGLMEKAKVYFEEQWRRTGT